MSDSESERSDEETSQMPNPTGKNQYKDCPLPQDETVNNLIREYDRRGQKNRERVSELLLADHSIKMSSTTVTRRRKLLGLKGSHASTVALPEITRRQLVLDQIAKDPSRQSGPSTVKDNVLRETGHDLTREFVEDVMRLYDPEGFELREPASKKVHREPLTSLGIHEEWSGDGHDKLTSIGFPVYGIRDKFSGKWLGLWVVPNNRLKNVVAYLYLTLIEEQGGMLIQTTTDCGSETTEVYGLANALREEFSPNLPVNEVPAHRFLRSIHNITIERGWLQLRLRWGDNVKFFWAAGENIYNQNDAAQYELVQWLWSTLIKQELEELKDKFNNHTVRYDVKKKLPSGVSPNVAYSLHQNYGGINCLQKVNMEVIRELKEGLGGEHLIEFVTPEYAAYCDAVFKSLQIVCISFENVWHVFSLMLPLL